MRFEQFEIEVKGNKVYLTQDNFDNDEPDCIELAASQIPHFIAQLQQLVAEQSREK